MLFGVYAGVISIRLSYFMAASSQFHHPVRRWCWFHPKLRANLHSRENNKWDRRPNDLAQQGPSRHPWRAMASMEEAPLVTEPVPEPLPAKLAPKVGWKAGKACKPMGSPLPIMGNCRRFGVRWLVVKPCKTSNSSCVPSCLDSSPVGAGGPEPCGHGHHWLGGHQGLPEGQATELWWGHGWNPNEAESGYQGDNGGSVYLVNTKFLDGSSLVHKKRQDHDCNNTCLGTRNVTTYYTFSDAG